MVTSDARAHTRNPVRMGLPSSDGDVSGYCKNTARFGGGYVMMEPMQITLTCPCGQKNAIASAKAGAHVACSACGKALTVPAMGVLATAKPRATPPVARRSHGALAWLCMAAGVLLLAGTGVALLIWSLSRGEPE